MVKVSYIVMVVILMVMVIKLNGECVLYCDIGHTHGGMVVVIKLNGECVLYCDGGHTHGGGDHTQW